MGAETGPRAWGSLRPITLKRPGTGAGASISGFGRADRGGSALSFQAGRSANGVASLMNRQILDKAPAGAPRRSPTGDFSNCISRPNTADNPPPRAMLASPDPDFLVALPSRGTTGIRMSCVSLHFGAWRAVPAQIISDASGAIALRFHPLRSSIRVETPQHGASRRDASNRPAPPRSVYPQRSPTMRPM